ncbi:MAG TPA: hypothetical protein VH062_27685 [Polyangiaceae bacterium]|jgi:hypothetical protein|nr:hypothetical protein [Polyangiaceae bacterium]
MTVKNMQKTNRTRMLWLLAVPALGAAASLSSRKTDREHPSANGQADEIANLRRTVDELKGRVELTGLVANSAAAASLAARRNGAALAVSSPDPQETAPPTQQPPETHTETEMIASTQAKFQNEVEDRAWTGTARAAAEQQIQLGLPPRSRVGELECRSTMCRATITHENVDAYRGYVQGILNVASRDWKGPFMATLVGTAPDGRAETEMYFFKDGHADPYAD